MKGNTGESVIMSQPQYEQLTAYFTEAERGELDMCRHPAGQTSLGAFELLCGWAQHVQKIDADRSKLASDRDVWVAHDLIAAFFLRGFLESCIGLLPDSLRDKLVERVSEFDKLFMSITQPDDGHVVERVMEESVAGRQWWWRRIPDSGPMLADLLEYE
jgi:hypothetical protein